MEIIHYKPALPSQRKQLNLQKRNPPRNREIKQENKILFNWTYRCAPLCHRGMCLYEDKAHASMKGSALDNIKNFKNI